MKVSLHVRLMTAASSTVFLCLSPMTASASVIEQSEATTSHTVSYIRLAQSGSMGGTIGNREKSLSGSREAAPERPARQSKPKESQRPAASHSSRGNLDGTWSISSAGINCSDTFRETVTINGARLVGNYGGGSVSANGSISGSGNYNGIGVTSRGRFSGRSGSGTFQRSDGCHGRWTATKQ
ncbi:MAG: hypothetical protein J0H71_01015 [Rhizobiales bacterium]|nr:hypothetical protein [Hyphomicrobiales bacterium]